MNRLLSERSHFLNSALQNGRQVATIEMSLSRVFFRPHLQRRHEPCGHEPIEVSIEQLSVQSRTRQASTGKHAVGFSRRQRTSTILLVKLRKVCPRFPGYWPAKEWREFAERMMGR